MTKKGHFQGVFKTLSGILNNDKIGGFRRNVCRLRTHFSRLFTLNFDAFFVLNYSTKNGKIYDNRFFPMCLPLGVKKSSHKFSSIVLKNFQIIKHFLFDRLLKKKIFFFQRQSPIFAILQKFFFQNFFFLKKFSKKNFSQKQKLRNRSPKK